MSLKANVYFLFFEPNIFILHIFCSPRSRIWKMKMFLYLCEFIFIHFVFGRTFHYSPSRSIVNVCLKRAFYCVCLWTLLTVFLEAKFRFNILHFMNSSCWFFRPTISTFKFVLPLKVMHFSILTYQKLNFNSETCSHSSLLSFSRSLVGRFKPSSYIAVARNLIWVIYFTFIQEITVLMQQLASYNQ